MRRHVVGRFISLIVPVRRYHCRECHWTGYRPRRSIGRIYVQRTLATLGLIFLLLLGVAGITGYALRNRLLSAAGALQSASRHVSAREVGAACADLGRANADFDVASALVMPFSPLMRRAGWVPRIGGDLVALPLMLDLGHATSAAGGTACPILEPILASSTLVGRLKGAAGQIADHPEVLPRARADLEQARLAYAALDPHLDKATYLAPYRDQIRTMGALLPQALATLDLLAEAGPRLPWLLGLDAPRRFVVISQNPFELRPTGGFIGIVCVVEVADARPRVEGCQPSESYNVASPNGDAMPLPYTQYLQLGNWYLRDANWYPDFPTSARTFQDFWALNNQPAADGVIAVDPFTFVPLLDAIGPLSLADGTTMTANEVVDVIHTMYYDEGTYRDKRRLGDLLPAMLDRMVNADLQTLPRLTEALRTTVSERHLLGYVDDAPLQSVLARHNWDGGIRANDGDVLRIVDADVGYGKVNAFVERLSHYDVALDPNGAPVTATLTLTYTNTYSPWNEATTTQEVNGQCTDPVSQELKRDPGCYANYMRVYVPQGSQLLGGLGLEQLYGVTQTYGRTVFGGYLRVNAGEQAVVQFRYLLPPVTHGRLTIEKQPGTVADPFLVTVHTPSSRAELWLRARTDRTLMYGSTPSGVAIAGVTDDTAQEAFAQQEAFERGLEQWQAGDSTTALVTWREGGALDRAIDYARADGVRDPDYALTLLEALGAVVDSGRPAFERATIMEAQGDLTSADRLYAEAAGQSQDNPFAQLTLARRLVQSGQPLPAASQLPVSASAARRWARTAQRLQSTGDITSTLTYLDVLVHVTPDDRAVALRYADLLQQNKQPEQALARYTALSTTDDYYGLVAGAIVAALNERPDEAEASYVRAIPLAPAFEDVIRIANALRTLERPQSAAQAYDRAVELRPYDSGLYRAAGDSLRKVDPVAARVWYERGRAVDQRNGFFDYALGNLLLDAGDAAGARASFEAALVKQPDSQEYRDALARAGALSEPTSEATP